MTAKAGDPCEVCGFELHKVSGEDLKTASMVHQSVLKSRSLPASVLSGRSEFKRKFYVVCPQCDAYAMGDNLILGLPLQDRSGRTTYVQYLPIFDQPPLYAEGFKPPETDPTTTGS